jgi:hypothetical protein
MANDMTEFRWTLLQSQYQQRWTHIVDQQTYHAAMNYMRHYYRVYVVLSAIDEVNQEIFWDELLLVSQMYYRGIAATVPTMTFDHFMNMTFFCMTAELEVQVIRREIDAQHNDDEYDEYDEDFKEALAACVSLV